MCLVGRSLGRKREKEKRSLLFLCLVGMWQFSTSSFSPIKFINNLPSNVYTTNNLINNFPPTFFIYYIPTAIPSTISPKKKKKMSSTITSVFYFSIFSPKFLNEISESKKSLHGTHLVWKCIFARLESLSAQLNPLYPKRQHAPRSQSSILNHGTLAIWIGNIQISNI